MADSTVTGQMTDQTKIVDVFEREMDQRIEPVVQVDAASDAQLAQEIEEYVVTPAIRDYFAELLENYLSLQEQPSQKIGIWVSGFFGSGKSSFAKMLGYALENRNLDGETVREKLLRRFGGDAKVAALFGRLDELEHERPTQAVVFDMSRDATKRHEFVSEAMYQQLLAHFGYQTDPVLAELELQLEREGRFEAFLETFEKLHGLHWKDAGFAAKNRASAVLHELEPATYPHKDSWAKTPHKVGLSNKLLANRAVEIAQRRGGGANLIFAIDEVGQFASRDIQRMLDLQGVAEAFGVGGAKLPENDGKNLPGVTPGSFKGRLWLMVTSQEQLEAVVENLDSQRTELGRLIDRFQNPVDLKPNDITEVTKQRLLKKKATFEPPLRALYAKHENALKLHSKLEAGYQRELNAQAFTDLYPLLPYQFDLIIDIIGTIRSQGQAGATYGAAVRPILVMISDLLNAPELGLAQSKVGKLVTFDEVYDILGHRIRADRRDSVDQIVSQLGASALETRAAKALVLLSMVRGVKKTLKSVAAVLYPAVGHASIQREVQAALEELLKLERVRFAEGEYEFLSQEARDWESERNGFDPGPDKRKEVRKVITSLVTSQTYNHKGLRTFTPTLVLDGNIPVGANRGDIELRLNTSSDDKSVAFADSQANPDAVSGVMPYTKEMEHAAQQLLRSRRMIDTYAQDKTRTNNVTVERQRASGFEGQLETEVAKALLNGHYYFRGGELETGGSNINRLVEGLFSQVVGKVFHKLDTLTIKPSTTDLKMLFTQDNLNSMNETLGPSGLGVLELKGGQTGITPAAPIFSDLKQHIEHLAGTGQSPSGLVLAQAFERYPYGWSTDRVRYLVAVLFRAGWLEMHAQGGRFTSWKDPGAQDVFESLQKFRQAQFTPRGGGVDLIGAVTAFEELTGTFIDQADEAIIADTVRGWVTHQATKALKIVGRLEHHDLPGCDTLKPVADTLDAIRNAASSEEILKLFLANVATFKEYLPHINKLEQNLTGGALNHISNARHALNVYYPAIPNPDEATREAAEKLGADLAAESFIDRLPAIQTGTKTLEHALEAAYQTPWRARYEAYERVAKTLEADAAFQSLEPDEADAYLEELRRYGGGSATPPEHAWQRLNPTLEHLSADTDAAENRLRQKLDELRRKLEPKAKPASKVSLRALHLTLEPEDDGALHKLEAGYQVLRTDVEERLKQGERVVLE